MPKTMIICDALKLVTMAEISTRENLYVIAKIYGISYQELVGDIVKAVGKGNFTENNILSYISGLLGE